ncbi:cytochrome C biosynthesis protein [Peptoniphilus asaccharolyticus]
MSKVMEAVGGNTEFILLSIYAIIIAIAVTIVLSIVAKRLKFAKYLPGIVLITIGIFVLFSVISDLFNPENVDALAVFLIGCSSGVISLLVALIFGIIQGGK